MKSQNAHSVYLGNKPEEAHAVVSSIYGPKSIKNSNNTGAENLVIVVNDSQVVRFPRSRGIWERGRIERRVLEELSNNPNLPIPRIVAINESPSYLIVKYLDGYHLDADEVRRLPVITQTAIGESLAEFAFSLHSAVPIEIIRPMLPEQKDTYDDYLERVLVKRTDPNPKIDALAKRYYRAWMSTQKAKNVVVHDDLHTGNLLFNDENKLSGILDFGAICIGSPEQDLRQTYRLGDVLFEAAASKYERLSGKPFNREVAKMWTITQELGAYCRSSSGEVHDRAKANLEFWFNELTL